MMQFNINPSYQIDNIVNESHFRSTFRGERAEDVDKVYFRRRDDFVDYTEAMFKNKHLITKK